MKEHVTTDGDGLAEFNCCCHLHRRRAPRTMTRAMRNNNSVSWLRVQWYFTNVLYIVRWDTDPAVD